MYAPQNALAQYRKINTESALEGASPYQLIQMLMTGALDRLVQARGALERQDIAAKGLLIGKAISIVAGLQASLDKSKSPEITENLDQLYDYMQRRLFEANLKNDPVMIDEVTSLMLTVKSGWDQINPASQKFD
ncbi:MAG: flagellar export chaperone FliS [Pseudomonadales bacterium]|nr:flagellar export chaperone FliS [Pseudomonadales bacterium]